MMVHLDCCEERTCSRACVHDHVCGNLFQCRTCGSAHVCDANCRQTIPFGPNEVICRISKRRTWVGRERAPGVAGHTRPRLSQDENDCQELDGALAQPSAKQHCAVGAFMAGGGIGLTQRPINSFASAESPASMAVQSPGYVHGDFCLM